MNSSGAGAAHRFCGRKGSGATAAGRACTLWCGASSGAGKGAAPTRQSSSHRVVRTEAADAGPGSRRGGRWGGGCLGRTAEEFVLHPARWWAAETLVRVWRLLQNELAPTTANPTKVPADGKLPAFQQSKLRVRAHSITRPPQHLPASLQWVRACLRRLWRERECDRGTELRLHFASVGRRRTPTDYLVAESHTTEWL